MHASMLKEIYMYSKVGGFIIFKEEINNTVERFCCVLISFIAKEQYLQFLQHGS